MEGEFLPGLDRHTLDFVPLRILQYRIGPPGPVDLPVEPGDRVVLLLKPVDEVLDLLRVPVVADQERIGRVHHDKVVHAYQAHAFARRMHIVVPCRQVLGCPGISLPIVRLDLVERRKGPEVIPLCIERHHGHLL